MKKDFDCVEMKRKAQQRVYDETREMSRQEELDYFREAGKEFWRGIQVLRRKIKATAAGRRSRLGSED